MGPIQIEHDPDNEKLKAMGVTDWPIWTKEISEFPWSYDTSETCYFLEGQVIVTPDGQDPVEMGKGDLVTFPAGMSCTWKILKDVKTRNKFSYNLAEAEPMRGNKIKISTRIHSL